MKMKQSFKKWLYLYGSFCFILIIVFANAISNVEANIATEEKEGWPDKYEVIYERLESRQVNFDAEKWYWDNGKDKVLNRIMLKYGRTIKMTSKRVGMNYRDYVPITVIESSGDINITGSAGEKCFSQVKNAAVEAVAKRFKVNFTNLFNPWDCSYAGAGYLKIQLDRFKDLKTAYVAYNRGGGSVSRKLKSGMNPREKSHYDDKAAYIKQQILKLKL